MIVGQREIIHRTNDDFPVLDNQPLLGRVNPQNGRLRRIDDRRRQHRSEYAAIGNRERSAGQFLHRELAVLRAFTKIGDLLFYIGKPHLVRVAYDRNDQSARTTYRHADIEVTMVDNVVAVNRGIDHRIFLQRSNHRFDEKRHESQFYAVFLFEFFAVCLAQFDDRLHVDFV